MPTLQRMDEEDREIHSHADDFNLAPGEHLVHDEPAPHPDRNLRVQYHYSDPRAMGAVDPVLASYGLKNRHY